MRALPGVGDYTAAAIAAIAFGRDSMPVDTNVERVVARLEAHDRTRRAIRAAAKEMMPTGEAGDFAQAMMDLGATICRPRAPDCPACPLAADCRAFALGTPRGLPAPRLSASRAPSATASLYWIERGGAVWLVRRPAKGMLGGMAALPGPDWTDQPAPAPALAEIRHVFTHFELRLSIVAASVARGRRLVAAARLAWRGRPADALYRRAAEAMLERRKPLAA